MSATFPVNNSTSSHSVFYAAETALARHIGGRNDPVSAHSAKILIHDGGMAYFCNYQGGTKARADLEHFQWSMFVLDEKGCGPDVAGRFGIDWHWRSRNKSWGVNAGTKGPMKAYGRGKTGVIVCQ
jgi:hypothetical protein